MFKNVLDFCLPRAFISVFILISASEPVAQIRPNTLSVKADLYSKYMGNGTKLALFLGLRPTQGSCPFKPFIASKEEIISAKIH